MRGLGSTAWKLLDSPYTQIELVFLCICLFSDKSMTFGIWELTLRLPFQEKTTKSQRADCEKLCSPVHTSSSLRLKHGKPKTWLSPEP